MAVNLKLGIRSSRTEWFHGPSAVPKETPPAPTKPMFTGFSASDWEAGEAPNALQSGSTCCSTLPQSYAIIQEQLELMREYEQNNTMLKPKHLVLMRPDDAGHAGQHRCIPWDLAAIPPRTNLCNDDIIFAFCYFPWACYCLASRLHYVQMR